MTTPIWCPLGWRTSPASANPNHTSAVASPGRGKRGSLMYQSDEECDPEMTELEKLRIKSTQDGPRKKEADRRRRRAMLKALQEKSNA